MDLHILFTMHVAANGFCFLLLQCFILCSFSFKTGSSFVWNNEDFDANMTNGLQAEVQGRSGLILLELNQLIPTRLVPVLHVENYKRVDKY